MRDDTRRLVIEVLEMSGGPLLWLLHLFAMYGASALICMGRLPHASGAGALLAVSLSVTALALAVSIGLFVRALRENAARAQSDAHGFVNRVTIALNVFAFVAILWTAVPLAIEPACDAYGGAPRAQRSS